MRVRPSKSEKSSRSMSKVWANDFGNTFSTLGKVPSNTRQVSARLSKVSVIALELRLTITFSSPVLAGIKRLNFSIALPGIMAWKSAVSIGASTLLRASRWVSVEVSVRRLSLTANNSPIRSERLSSRLQANVVRRKASLSCAAGTVKHCPTVASRNGKSSAGDETRFISLRPELTLTTPSFALNLTGPSFSLLTYSLSRDAGTATAPASLTAAGTS